MNCGFLASLLRVLNESVRSRSSSKIIADAMWSLSNVAGGTRYQVRKIAAAGFIPHIIRLASTYDAPTSVMWVLENLTNSNDDQVVDFLVQVQFLSLFL